MKISILEQVPLFENRTAETTFEELVALAQAVEQVGYSRFWLAEHHNSAAMLSTTPDLLASYILSKTHSIRVGTGGIMAMHYGALQLAERFNLLASLYPNRVDMGLSRASDGNLMTAQSLNQGRVLEPHAIDRLIEETIGLMRKHLPKGHHYQQLTVSPHPQTAPEMWLLDATGQSAEWAAQQGINYGYAQFFSGQQDPQLLAKYRANYAKTGTAANTLSALCIIADESEALAQEKALSMMSFRYQLALGRPAKFETPDAFSEDYRQLIRSYADQKPTAFIGSYDQVAEQISAFQAKHEADEIMLITYLPDWADKAKLYTELAARLM